MSAPDIHGQFRFRFTRAEWANLTREPGFFDDPDNADLPRPRLMGLQVEIVDDHRAALQRSLSQPLTA